MSTRLGFMLLASCLCLPLSHARLCSDLLPQPFAADLQVPPTHWWPHVGEIWFRLFAKTALSHFGTVVEVAPGSAEKIGLGLSRYGFGGTLYVVEPHPEALTEVVQKYRRLLPRAKIRPIGLPLEKAWSQITEPVDALVSNHPLDDMILASFLSDGQFQEFFSRIYERNHDRVGAELWRELARRAEPLRRGIDQTVLTWSEVITQLAPRWVFIGQYPAQYYARFGTDIADVSADEALRRLKMRWPSASWANFVLNSIGQDPRFWLVHESPREWDQVLRARPRALARHPEKLFLEVPARRLGADEIEVAYLSSTVFDAIGFRDPPAVLESRVLEGVAVDLETEGLPTDARVWVDRQADPQGIALNGNGGAGRAGYVSELFNVKGFGRTPLAFNSPDDVHGTGRVAFSASLWEAVASNSLWRDLRTGASPVAAVLRMKKKMFRAPWGDHPLVRAGQVIRYDEGALDRPSHWYEAPPESPDVWRASDRFGEQDAEKNLERVEHGAPSAGNISVDGDIIDMDTLGVVVGRGPRYSLTGWFPGNYFGLEGIAHRALLESMAAHLPVDPERLKNDPLDARFDTARQNQLLRRFPDLIGLDPKVGHKVRYFEGPALAALLEEFKLLAAKIRPDLSVLYTGASPAEPPELFDFSQFFRFYFFFRQKGRMVPPELWIARRPDLRFVDHARISPETKTFLRARFTVENEEDWEKWKARALRFAESYGRFIDSLEARGLFGDPRAAALRAYRVNESRPYLSDTYGARTVFAIADEFDRGGLARADLQYLIDWIIEANGRYPDPREAEFAVDSHLFREGSFRRLLSPNLDQRLEVTVFDRRSDSDGSWRLEVAGQTVEATVEKSGPRTKLVSRLLPFDATVDGGAAAIALYDRGQRVRFTQWTAVSPPSPFALTEAP